MPIKNWTPERLARQRANESKWHKANAEVLNFKRRNRYATDPEYRERRKQQAIDCGAGKMNLMKAA